MTVAGRVSFCKVSPCQLIVCSAFGSTVERRWEPQLSLCKDECLFASAFLDTSSSSHWETVSSQLLLYQYHLGGWKKDQK